MKSIERIAIVRILTDLIKADSIIDSGEMEMYVQLKKKYNITQDDEIHASHMTLGESMDIMHLSELSQKETILRDCAHMTVSDGFCAHSEALLMLALKYVLSDKEGNQVISILKPTFNIAASSIIYIESEYNNAENADIMVNYRAIYKEVQIAGFNFIYIPTIVQHYHEADTSLINRIIAFLAPTMSQNSIERVISNLNDMTTASFCKDMLCNKLGISVLRNTSPALLIKIGQSYVNNRIYSNYLKMEVDEEILLTIQSLVDEFVGMVSADWVAVNTAQEQSHQFLYHGFYKQLLDIFLNRKNVRSNLYVHPFKEEILFLDIDTKLDKLHRREKSLYMLFLVYSTEGGINFNLPKSAKQLASYNRKLERLQKQYQTIYGAFGGGIAPDLSRPEIRRPIIACLRRSLFSLKDRLYNADDYMVNKNEFGFLNVNIEKELIYLYDIELDDYVVMIESKLYQKLKEM